jgi:hypothetical protein
MDSTRHIHAFVQVQIPPTERKSFGRDAAKIEATIRSLLRTSDDSLLLDGQTKTRASPKEILKDLRSMRPCKNLESAHYFKQSKRRALRYNCRPRIGDFLHQIVHSHLMIFTAGSYTEVRVFETEAPPLNTATVRWGGNH